MTKTAIEKAREILALEVGAALTMDLLRWERVDPRRFLAYEPADGRDQSVHVFATEADVEAIVRLGGHTRTDEEPASAPLSRCRIELSKVA